MLDILGVGRQITRDQSTLDNGKDLDLEIRMI